MTDGKDKSFYYCTNCEQQIATLATGVCPLCNSQAVMPVGWDQVSTQERADWFQRIRGGRRSTTARTGMASKQLLEKNKSEV